MINQYFQVIEAFRNAVFEGRVCGPDFNDVWFRAECDSYFSLDELAAHGMEYFNEKDLSPSRLVYALKFGSESEKARAQEAFEQALNSKDANPDFYLWYPLIPFLAIKNPYLYELYCYKSGALDSLNPREAEGLLLSCHPGAVADLIKLIDTSLNLMTKEPFRFQTVVGFLEVMGFEARQIIPSALMERLAACSIRAWEELRFDPSNEIPFCGISQDWLHVSALFGWDEVLAELSQNPVFMMDCLHPKSELLVGVASTREISLSALSLSLTSTNEALDLWLEDPGVIDAQCREILNNIEISSFSSNLGNQLKLKRLILWPEYPTEIPRQELKIEWMRSAGVETNLQQSIILYEAFQPLWQLRLAREICAQRRGIELHDKLPWQA